jgi:hypothetical protein
MTPAKHGPRDYESPAPGGAPPAPKAKSRAKGSSGRIPPTGHQPISSESDQRTLNPQVSDARVRKPTLPDPERSLEKTEDLLGNLLKVPKDEAQDDR